MRYLILKAKMRVCVMEELKTKLAQLKQAGKLEKIKLYTEIMALAQKQAPDKLLGYFDELLGHYTEYLQQGAIPPTEIAELISKTWVKVFFEIRNAADIPSFDKYSTIYHDYDLQLYQAADRAGIYQVFGYMFWLKNDIEKSIQYLSDSIKILKDNEIYNLVPERYTNLGFVHEYMGNLGQAEKLYKEGLKFAKQHNYEEALITAYSGMGRLNLQRNDFPAAIKYLERNLALIGENSMDRERVTVIVNLALAYMNLKNYDKALELNLQLDNKILEENDLELYYTVILNTGCCYSDQGDYAKARQYFEKAHNYAKQKGDYPQLIFSLMNMGRIAKLESKPQQALIYLNEALDYAEKANNNSQLLSLHSLIGEALFMQENYAEALKHYERVYRIGDSLAEIGLSPGIAKSMALCYEKQGHFEQAIHFLKISLDMKDNTGNKPTEPDEELSAKKVISTGQKTHYLFSESMSLISRELNEKIGHWLVGSSKEIQEVVERAFVAAKNEGINVMIYGESGTGKELIARLIHHSGRRAGHPFIEVNSAVFTTSLAESSLFGHKKGAFTSAHESHIGYFAAAHRGTLFLDEISEMPPEIQSMMLRVLEAKQIKPLGSNTTMQVDFRLICASNHDIKQLVSHKAFRFDLFSRINALEIHLPPLRERKSDIPLLINFFLTQLAGEMGIKVPVVTPKALDLLCSYSYPGNVRELKFLIQRLLLFVKNNRIDTDDIEINLGNKKVEHKAKENLDLEANERYLIKTAMGKSRNVVSEAAKLLGISPYALSRRIKKYTMEFC